MSPQRAFLGLPEQTDQYVCSSTLAHTNQSEWI